MKTLFHKVIPSGDRFKVMLGKDQVRSIHTLSCVERMATGKTCTCKSRFTTVQLAKHACLTQLGINPVRTYGDEVRFDPNDPLHKALAIIEQRHNGYGEIVAVGSEHYVKRRTRFGIEEPIKYKVKGDFAHARKDSQLII